MVSHSRERPAWQSLDSGQLVVLGAAGAIILASAAQLAAQGGAETPRTAVIFAVLIALGGLFRMNMPGGRVL